MTIVVDHRIQMRDKCIICGTWEVFFRHPLWSLQPSLLVLCLWQQFVTFFFSGFHILCRLSSILIFSFSFSFNSVICFISSSPLLFYSMYSLTLCFLPPLDFQWIIDFQGVRVRGSNWLPEEWAQKPIFLEHMLLLMKI